MKTCSTCGKKDQKFNRNPTKKDGLQSVCRICQSEYTKQHYRKNKKPYLDRARKGNLERRTQFTKIINNLKDVPCTDCSRKYPPYVMDFDHIEGHKKLASVSSFRAHTLERALEEVKKCEVVCSNCHRERTHIRRKSQW